MAASKELRDTLTFYNRLHADPTIFAKEILGVATWWQQDEIIRSVFQHLETGVKSCHASGKTKTAAICALTWLMYWPPGSAMVITTSSSWLQVEREIWGEIRRCIGQSKWPWPKPNLTDLTMPGGSYALGLSTNDAINFHGFHAEHVLIIVDEASGVEDSIYLALSGIKAGGDVHLLYLMNPTETSGWSVDIFDDPRVCSFTIDGLDSPNMACAGPGWALKPELPWREEHVTGRCSPEGVCPGVYHLYESEELNDRDPDSRHNLLLLGDTPLGGCELDDDGRPYLIRKRYVRDMYLDAIRKWGSLKPQSDWYPRVRGQFPTELASQLVLRDWVEAAHKRRLDRRDTQTIAGIDVAGPGKDETVICLRSGYQVTYQEGWADADPYDKIIDVLGPPRPTLWVHVDAVAIGFQLAAALVRAGYQVVFVNAANRPYDTTRFMNYKAEAYWKLRELFQDGEIGGPINPRCQRQLLTLRWDQKNAKRLIRIEPKDDAAKRGVPSPDWAEAMMLSFAGDPHGLKTGEWVYDNAVVSSGPVPGPLAGGELTKGPGWFGGDAGWQAGMAAAGPLAGGGVGEMPPAMRRWMEAHGKVKAEQRRGPPRGAVDALLHQVTSERWNDPQERARLLALVQEAN